MTPNTTEIDTDRSTVLYYDERLRRWVSILYIYNGDTIIVKVSKSGYYAIKEEYIETENSCVIDELYSIIDPFKITTTLFTELSTKSI